MDRVRKIAGHIMPAPAAAHPVGKMQEMIESRIRMSPEVQEALATGRPVVALESTIITHGMPWPDNFNTALAVEGIVRAEGAVPATIAIVDGVIHVGCNKEMLESLSKMPKGTVRKCSRRDLALVLAQNGHGSTTVAATMVVAHAVGIRVFVTGGIGGVHRGAEETFDISADLTELGRTPVTVVCAGAKSILDIEKTLEYLETQGVTVVGYGQDQFPAFYTRRSGFDAPCRLNSPEECASLVAWNAALGLTSGIVIGVPIPAEHEGAVQTIEAATTRAIEEATKQGVKGREATPFLLKRVAELSGGESLRANVELIKNNAVVGSRIAVKVAATLN